MEIILFSWHFPNNAIIPDRYIHTEPVQNQSQYERKSDQKTDRQTDMFMIKQSKYFHFYVVYNFTVSRENIWYMEENVIIFNKILIENMKIFHTIRVY